MNTKILLVDDEAGICKVLGISLTDSGYDVQTAQSGEQALKIFDDLQPPIVITDIKMPAMDGIELLREIKGRRPDTEVIMITGHGDIDLAIESLKFEATDFITKPINEDALEVALKRAHEKIELKRQLRTYTEKLEQLVEEKTARLVDAQRLAAVGETAAGLAHAIKNIASGLKGGGFVLEQGIKLADRQLLDEGWQLVRGNVEKITRLSMDLLDFAKPSEIRRGWCDPNLPAREVFELMRARAHAAGVALEAHLDDTLAPVMMDHEGIYRCLLNLVTNAIDACSLEAIGQQNSKVVIRTVKTEDQGVAYQVADNGAGMDEDTRGKLFQMFFTTKGSRGTGLGLMLTKKIVDLHHGRISVASRKAEGSRFTINLPA